MDGKRRLIPKLVGFRLLMKRLNCTVNWLRVRLESREVCIACQEMFSLVAFWNAFSAGRPAIQQVRVDAQAFSRRIPLKRGPETETLCRREVMIELGYNQQVTEGRGG